MRKNNPSLKHRQSMLRNHGHIHNYAVPKGTKHRGYMHKQVYQCSLCDATTSHKF